MSKKLDVVYASFLKLIESGKNLTIDDIKKTVDFKKLSASEQKKLENLLIEKIKLLEKQTTTAKKIASKYIKKTDSTIGTVRKNVNRKLRKIRKEIKKSDED